MPLLFFFLPNPKAFPILVVGDAGDPRLSLPRAAINIRTRPPRHRSASFPKTFPPFPSIARGARADREGARVEGIQGMGV